MKSSPKSRPSTKPERPTPFDPDLAASVRRNGVYGNKLLSGFSKDHAERLELLCRATGVGVAELCQVAVRYLFRDRAWEGWVARNYIDEQAGGQTAEPFSPSADELKTLLDSAWSLSAAAFALSIGCSAADVAAETCANERPNCRFSDASRWVAGEVLDNAEALRDLASQHHDLVAKLHTRSQSQSSPRVAA